MTAPTDAEREAEIRADLGISPRMRMILGWLDAARRGRDRWQIAEKTLSDAYIRLRQVIPGAMDTPFGPSGEEIWRITEVAACKLRNDHGALAARVEVLTTELGAMADHLADLQLERDRFEGRVEALTATLLRLANAADDVGVRFFDTEWLEPEVLEMQNATEEARKALSSVPEAGGSPEVESVVVWTCQRCGRRVRGHRAWEAGHDYVHWGSLRCGGRVIGTTQPLAASPEASCVVDARAERQKKVWAWCIAAFGASHTTSIPQRGIRMLEEAIELAQACGCHRAMAHNLLDFVYDRPAGTIEQELGGVGLTVLALANAAGLSADAAEAKELARVLSKPLAQFHARNAAKNAAGFDVLAYPTTQPTPGEPRVQDAAPSEARPILLSECPHFIGTDCPMSCSHTSACLVGSEPAQGEGPS